MAANDSQADIKALLEKSNCAACHGNTGVSVNDEWPNIAGQNFELLRKELKEFRDGRRTNPLMSPVAKSLSDAEIDLLADYFSAQRPSVGKGNPLAPDATRHEEAKMLSGTCMGCHGPDGISRKPDWAPNLAGQKRGYLLQQFKNFRDGTRGGEFMPPTVY